MKNLDAECAQLLSTAVSSNPGPTACTSTSNGTHHAQISLWDVSQWDRFATLLRNRSVLGKHACDERANCMFENQYQEDEDRCISDNDDSGEEYCWESDDESDWGE